MRMPSSPSLWLLSDVDTVERVDKAGLGDFARGRAIRASAVTWRCDDDDDDGDGDGANDGDNG